MNTEARLMAALGGPAAPARDPRFTLAVLQAAEADRYRKASAQAILRGAGLAAAAAALLVPFLGWAGANADALQSGVVGAAGLLTLVGAARLMTVRAAAVLRR